jgi:GNAT superfamily N-acetyltransferase
VITDQAVFGYLADVFVVPEYRGRGISKGLMEAILQHPDLQTLKVFLLRTRDAHGLYERFGFRPISRPEEMMSLAMDTRRHEDTGGFQLCGSPPLSDPCD